MLQSREKEFQRNNAIILCDLYGNAQAQEPWLTDHKICNFGRPFLGHHYYLLFNCQKIKEKNKNRGIK